MSGASKLERLLNYHSFLNESAVQELFNIHVLQISKYPKWNHFLCHKLFLDKHLFWINSLLLIFHTK